MITCESLHEVLWCTCVGRNSSNVVGGLNQADPPPCTHSSSYFTQFPTVWPPLRSYALLASKTRKLHRYYSLSCCHLWHKLPCPLFSCSVTVQSVNYPTRHTKWTNSHWKLSLSSGVYFREWKRMAQIRKVQNEVMKRASFLSLEPLQQYLFIQSACIF